MRISLGLMFSLMDFMVIVLLKCRWVFIFFGLSKLVFMEVMILNIIFNIRNKIMKSVYWVIVGLGVFFIFLRWVFVGWKFGLRLRACVKCRVVFW